LLLFLEGFAQYATEKIGMSQKLLSIYHEIHAPYYYHTGRKMYEMVEYAFGKERAISIALASGTTEFFAAYREALNRRYEMITQAAARLLPLLKEAGIYRRWLLFWRRFDKKFEEGMLEYIRNHYGEKFSNEFPGWPKELVLIEALYSTVADYVLLKLGKQVGDRRVVMDALVYFAAEGKLKRLREFMTKMFGLVKLPVVYDYMKPP